MIRSGWLVRFMLKTRCLISESPAEDEEEKEEMETSPGRRGDLCIDIPRDHSALMNLLEKPPIDKKVKVSNCSNYKQIKSHIQC